MQRRRPDRPCLMRVIHVALAMTGARPFSPKPDVKADIGVGSFVPGTDLDGSAAKRPTPITCVYDFFLASGLATSRAASMNSCAAGLSIRFLRVRIPIGPLTIGSSIGNFLMNGCVLGNVNTDSGWIVK